MGKATTALVTAVALAAPLFSPVAEPLDAVERPPVVEEANSDFINYLSASPSELLSRFLPQKAEASHRLSPYVVVMECRPVRSYTLRIFVDARSYGDAIVRAWLDWRVRQECRVISVVHEPSGRIYVPGEPTPAQPSGIISSMNAAKREIARYFEELGLTPLGRGEIWTNPGYITERRFVENGTVVTTPITSTANYGKIIVLYDMPPAESDMEARRIRNCDALVKYVNPRLAREEKTANYIQLPPLPTTRGELIAWLDRGLRGETDCPPLYR